MHSFSIGLVWIVDQMFEQNSTVTLSQMLVAFVHFLRDFFYNFSLELSMEIIFTISSLIEPLPGLLWGPDAEEALVQMIEKIKKGFEDNVSVGQGEVER